MFCPATSLEVLAKHFLFRLHSLQDLVENLFHAFTKQTGGRLSIVNHTLQKNSLTVGKFLNTVDFTEPTTLAKCDPAHPPVTPDVSKWIARIISMSSLSWCRSQTMTSFLSLFIGVLLEFASGNVLFQNRILCWICDPDESPCQPLGGYHRSGLSQRMIHFQLMKSKEWIHARDKSIERDDEHRHLWLGQFECRDWWKAQQLAGLSSANRKPSITTPSTHQLAFPRLIHNFHDNEWCR